MENKKKPSANLILSPNSNFVGECTPFERKMLEWPIIKYRKDDQDNRKLLDSVELLVYRTALQAMLDMAPFQFYVSIKVDKKSKQLLLVRNTWAQIYLGGQKFLSIGYSIKNHNEILYSLLEWPELKPYGTKYSAANELAKYWNVERWKKFFKLRIRQQATHLVIGRLQLALALASAF
jgi:hypothetical protein